MVAMTVSVVGLITDTVPRSPFELATKTSPASGPVGLTATPCGALPTGMVRPLIPFWPISPPVPQAPP